MSHWASQSQRLALFLLGTVLATAVSAQDEIDFVRDIRPILSDRCVQCHGPDDKARKAELRLDQPVTQSNEGVLIGGKPNDSELIRRIESNDPEVRMPPAGSGKSLSPAEIKLVRRWVASGAKWSRHWAWEKPGRPKPPKVAERDWARGDVDRFILARLEAAGLKPAPDADDITLLRRLSFDLTGLPPTIDDVRAIQKKNDSAAWEAFIDRCLVSDAFGERMAVYWLDLVRFADTVGYHGDQDHAITPYRDWVIDAFIDNMPFDRFTREQLAGDLVPDSNIDQKIASGYNRLLQTSHEGGVQAKEYLAMYAADRVRNLSAVWLGGTLGCAQCHSHKYDPYTMRDFYSMAAFFADIDEEDHLRRGDNNLPTKRAPELVVHTRREREELARLDAKIANWEEQVKKALNQDATRKHLAEAKARREKLAKSARRTMISKAIEPRVTRILPRGNWLDDSGPIVEPAVPAFLGTVSTGDRRATRLDLANWLTDAENGAGLLTARVMVNRFWYLLFGQGLSRSLDDFGGQGEPPSHPELLDWLAHEFVDSGWDVKHLLKLLVTSRTYRQSSIETDEMRAKDPTNRLFSRQSRYRLPAEFVRDNALAISGLLVRKIGGPGVKPYQPAGYYRHLNFPKRKYVSDTDDRQWRRGLYVHWQRQFLHPMMKAFDAPRREECTARRTRSNTPLSALTMLNDPTFVEAARAFAERIMKSGGVQNSARLEFAFLSAVSRSPDEIEERVLLKLLEQQRGQFADDEDRAKKVATVGLTPASTDVDAKELAAWTAVARVILNLSETSSRN